jgi:opacity protein-like surface antigen
MSKDHAYLLALALGLAAAFLAGFLGARRIYAGKEPQTVVKTETDTLYLRDTITVSTPIIRYVTRVSVDTFRVADTVRLRDTLFVALDREQVEWRDSLATVWASGVRPRVDSVRHYVTERVVTNTVTVTKTRKTRWGVGVQAGYGVSDEGLTPYIGAGVTYNLLAW